MICFHKWQHITFPDGKRVPKNSPDAVLKYCIKCGERRSKAIIPEYLFWFIPYPVIEWNYIKIPRKPWWKFLKKGSKK
jgi:hypothetical protein